VISMLTNVPEVNQVADEYFLWVLAAPIVSLWCYLLDGIFIGATRTVEMRNAMLISLGVYLGSWYLLQGWDNHGLWAALMVYFVARAFTLGLYLPRVSRWGES